MHTLADVADVEALLGSAVANDQAVAMLRQASAKFRAEAWNSITADTATMVLRVEYGRVDLPRRPVTSVTSVKAINSDGTVGAALVGWLFDGLHTVSVGDMTWVINGPNLQPTDTVEITWEYGYPDIPEDVRWTVAQMTARAISNPSPSGVTQESIGSYSYSTGGYTASGAMGMTRDEMDVAKRYRPRTSSASAVVR